MCSERCKHIVALVDSTKIGIDSASNFIPTEKIDYLITDNGIDDMTVELCKKRGIKVIVAG